MAKIDNVSELNDNQIYYIVNKLSISQPPEKVKDEFEHFFNTRISGDVIIAVGLSNMEVIKKRREEAFANEDLSDIYLASLPNQLRRLDEIFTECMKGIPVIDKDGNLSYKLDLSTAERATTNAAKIIIQHKLLKIKQLEVDSPGSYSQINSGTPMMPQIVKYDE